MSPGHNIGSCKGRPIVIQGPGEFEIGGVFITGVRTNGKKRNPDEPITRFIYLTMKDYR
jgi:hypothetical protein